MLTKLFVFINTTDCKSLALGMENRSIPDSSIAASAYSRGFAPRNARLNNPTSCWKLKINGSYTGEISLTIQLNQITMVTRISTQGDPKEASWVTQFWLQYLDSSSQRKRFYGKDNKLMVRGFGAISALYPHCF